VTAPVCGTSLDLVLLVADTSSTQASEWPDVLHFLVNVTKLFPVGSRQTRVGIVQYSTEAVIVYRLTDYQSRSSVTSAIYRMQLGGGGGSTGNLAAALNVAFNQLFAPAPRAGADKVRCHHP